MPVSFGRGWPRSLFANYAVSLALLVTGVLLASGLRELYAAYVDHVGVMGRLQYEKATVAATKIEQFIQTTQRQIAATASPEWVGGPQALEERRLEYLRLLRQAPAVSAVSYLDASGREQVRVSRTGLGSPS